MQIPMNWRAPEVQAPRLFPLTDLSDPAAISDLAHLVCQIVNLDRARFGSRFESLL